MAQQTPEREGAPADGPSVVQITVEVEPRAYRLLLGRLARAGAPRNRRAILAVALALVVAGSVIAVLRAAGTSAPPSARTDSAQSAKIAAAYGYRYPRRCLRVTIFSGSPDFARAHVDRSGRCARYHGYLNATFHLVDGSWRLVLDEGQLFVPNSSLGG